jgi:hypothetical protein
MLQQEKTMTMQSALVDDFVDKEIVRAVKTLTESDSSKTVSSSALKIATAFGADRKALAVPAPGSEDKLVKSFNSNLTLLIQKTWVEKSDSELKEQVLYQLGQFCEDIKTKSWADSYTPFLDIIYNAVYLMFGTQTKSDDFLEYAFRIDPEFGIFWFYIQSLPHETSWSDEKCRIAVLLGMYFLANY